MKTTSYLLNAAALSLAASPALAAGKFDDNSGIFVWGFLAFCALIIVAQVLPAVLMGMGIIKGMAEKKEEAREVVH